MIWTGIFIFGFPIIVAALQNTTKDPFIIVAEDEPNNDTRRIWTVLLFVPRLSYDKLTWIDGLSRLSYDKPTWIDGLSRLSYGLSRLSYDTPYRSFPCVYNSGCYHFGRFYDCSCPQGFTGHNCEGIRMLSPFEKMIEAWYLEVVKVQQTIFNFENAGRKCIWSDVESCIAMAKRYRYEGNQTITEFLPDLDSWIAMDTRYRYVDHLQTEKGKQTITYLQNAGLKFIWLNVESWIEMPNTYRYVVDHPEKAKGTHALFKMQNAGWKFILANVKSLFKVDNKSRNYDFNDYQISMFEISYKHQSNQILQESNLKYKPSCHYSEETDIYNRDILLNELKIQRSMESLHGIESTALLATFMLAAFAIRIVSEEELIKDTLTHSPIVKITTKEVRQNLPRRAEEEAFRQCGFCINHNQAIAYCNTCKLNICMPCKNTHKKVWTYINHTVCLFDEM